MTTPIVLPHDEYWILVTAITDYERVVREVWPVDDRDRRLAQVRALRERFAEGR